MTRAPEKLCLADLLEEPKVSNEVEKENQDRGEKENEKDEKLQWQNSFVVDADHDSKHTQEAEWTTLSRRRRPKKGRQSYHSFDSTARTESILVNKRELRPRRASYPIQAGHLEDPASSKTSVPTVTEEQGALAPAASASETLDEAVKLREVRFAQQVSENSIDEEATGTFEFEMREHNSASWGSSRSIGHRPSARPTVAQLAGLWNEEREPPNDTEPHHPSSPNPFEFNAESWNSRMSAGDPTCPLNLCEINTASWNSHAQTQNYPWLASEIAYRDTPDVADHWRDLNAASLSSRSSVPDADALNLCEVNTASWNSNCNPWQARWNPRGGTARGEVRSLQDIMADLSRFGGLHCQVGDGATSASAAGEPNSGIAHGPSSLTAEALASLSKSQDVGTDAIQHQSLNGVGHHSHSHSRLHHHTDHMFQSHQLHQFHHNQHQFHHTPLQQHHHCQLHQHHSSLGLDQELPSVPEDSGQTLEQGIAKALEHSTSKTKTSKLPEEILRERRHNNLLWRLWAASRTGNGGRVSLPDPASFPNLPFSSAAQEGHNAVMPNSSEFDSLWLRESRWERKCANVAHRSTTQSGQQVSRQGVQRVLQFWQRQRHRSVSPTARGRWPVVGRSLSPPEATSYGGEGDTISQALRAASTSGGASGPASNHGSASPLHVEMSGTSPLAGNMPMSTGCQSAEEHVLVAVPVSRLEAVARVLDRPSLLSAHHGGNTFNFDHRGTDSFHF
eukprot:TRINITY_DN9160_c3_g1_i1.p1 TRINITY_DN9160_c3_g1~~TRINITY_DN9160_c3_g1_i1.p1  ORF type:complete len:810 (+),score=127.91 TRINITY_DN9160_c3_g1_i1:233-2431(+)